MCRMPRPSANAEGRFLFLTYAGKEDILNMLKVAQMAPHEDYGREQPEAGTAFDTSARPRRYGYGRISASGNCVWAVREV